jgi:hypothetical protein
MRGNIFTCYISKHAAAAYKDDNVQLKDHLRELGFPNKAFMFYRFVGGGQYHGTLNRAVRGSAHCDMILDQLPGYDNIVTDV